MKINFVLPDNSNKPIGGIKVVFEYANWLSEHGYDVFLSFGTLDIFSKFHLPNIIRKPLAIVVSKYIRPNQWFKLNKNIKKYVFYNMNEKRIRNADVVIATAIETAKPVMRLPNSCGKKVYFIQDFENWNCTDEDVYQTYNLGMTNIVVANWLKNIVDAHSKTPAYLVSNCINTQVFNNKGAERIKHSIVFHYRSADYKGPEYAIEAIRILEEKYPDLKVDVISIEDAPNNLPKSCKFHHKLSAEQIAEINNRTQVFMCTSVEEGFGLPGLEAMACGCAVVSSSYKGVLEYAVDGENALLSPVRDVDAMVNNIVRLFEDDELIKRISENGVKTGKERSLEKSAQKFEEVLINSIKRG
jgi:glycosyltransferase involved in cell wall biosynthesis